MNIVGRRNELASLRDEWQRAARGEGRAVFIGGEAGIGKTTLVQALSEFVSAHGGAVFRGAAASHQETAYAAFAEIAQEMGADIFTPARNDDERLRCFEAFTGLLQRRADETPVLVVMEDLHWAANATIDLLRYAILRLPRARVLFVATYREFQAADPHLFPALRRELSENPPLHQTWR